MQAPPNTLDPDELRRLRIKDMNRKYDQLVERLQFMDHHLPALQRKYKYSSDTLMPYLYFFKYMARRPYDSEETADRRLRVWVPDTIVLNDHDCPSMWFYSSVEGYVYRSDVFVQKNVTEKFTEGATHDDELVAVQKRPQYRHLELVGNDVKPILVRDLSTSNIMDSRGDTTILQRFVRPKGPKAFICRTVWRRNSNPVAWVITNKTDMMDVTQTEHNRVVASCSRRFSCTIFQCSGGRFVTDTMPYVHAILQWMRTHYKVEFDELACDFIHARDDKWYFINLRGILIQCIHNFTTGFSISKCQVPLPTKQITHYGDEQPPPITTTTTTPTTKRHTNQRKRACKFCQVVHPQHELTHSMTLKQLMETDMHLLHRGRRTPWIAQRALHHHVDIAMLFAEYGVCHSCYTLYLACEALSRLELLFAQKMGVEVTQDTRYNAVSLTHLDPTTKGRNVIKQANANSISGNGENYIMPPHWELHAPLNSEILVHNPLHQTTTQLNQYRMIILLHKVGDIPPKFIQEGGKFAIQFTWFNQSVSYLLDLTQAQPHSKGYSLQLSRAKMFYLFAHTRHHVEMMLTAIPKLSIQLLLQGQQIGQLECELSDLKSARVLNRNFFKSFSGSTISPPLSWALHASIGLADSGPCDTQDTHLVEFAGVYLPQSCYYTCESLPPEWMNLFQSQPNQVVRRRCLSLTNNNEASRYPSTMNASFQGNPAQDAQQSFTQEDQQLDVTSRSSHHQNKLSKHLRNLLDQEIFHYQSEQQSFLI